MLRVLRNKKTAKKVWIVLAIIIIPAFTLWGFGSSSRSKQDSAPAGKIFGKTVSTLDFNKSLSATRTAAIMQFGDNFPKVEKYLQLESQAWERLILLEEARRRRLNVSDQEVVDAIQNAPYFQRNSAFDNKTYTEVLHYVFRLQPRTFEEQLRQNLILSKLYDQVTADVKIGDSRVRQEWLDKNEELSVDYIAALFDDFAKKIKPSDKDIAEYYDKHKEEFREPASLNLEYISTGSEKESKKITELAGDKYDLEKISKELGLPKNETGLFKQYNPPPSLKIPQGTLNAAMKLKEGLPAPVVKIDKSYYAFALKEKKPGAVPELDKLKDRIKEIIVKQDSRKNAQDKIKECAETLKIRPFEQAAKALKLTFGESKPFKSTDSIDNLGAGKMFWEAAKKLKEGQVSDVLSDSKGFYIIKLKELKPVDEDKFNKEKDALKEKMLSEEKTKVFTKFAEESKKKAQ